MMILTYIGNKRFRKFVDKTSHLMVEGIVAKGVGVISRCEGAILLLVLYHTLRKHGGGFALLST